MEALPTIDKIDDEIIQAQRTFKQQLGIECEYNADWCNGKI
jgi:hypothetical protein